MEQLGMKPRGRGRPPLQNRRIVVELRRDVLKGVLLPGSRLPVRKELLNRFGVSSATLQAAIDQLRSEGLLRAQGTQGTFVEATPPHLHDVALVAIPGIEQSLFDKALLSAGEMLGGRHGFRVRDYSIDNTRAYSPDAERLRDDVVNGQFSAMILRTGFSMFRESPILQEPGIDRVAVTGVDEETGIEMPRVRLDLRSVGRRAIEYLQSRGRKRIAHIGFVTETETPTLILHRLKQWQPELRPLWVQLIPECDAAMRGVAGNMVNLLMHLEGENRVDALVIHDDNLIEHSVAGLLAAGVAVPREVEVVAHTNFPLLARSSLPLKRVGFDCTTVMEQCMQLIEQLRARGEVVSPPPLGVVLDSELQETR